MAEITYQMVLSTLQTVGLLVGIFYYVTSLRNQSKARKTQLYLQMVNKFTEPDMIDAQGKLDNFEWSTGEDFVEDWKTPEGRKTIATLGSWYEGLGTLVKENLLDMRVVALLLTGHVILYWDKFIPVVDEVREALEWPRFCIETEYLYDQLIKYIKEHPEIQT
jgi:hypothetical protein